jgi:outer membrane protein TolC
VKIFLLVSFLLASASFALTLEEVINSSLAKNPSLEAINARLEANKQNIKIANNFKNPELSVTKNTLDDSQAMSQTVLTFKQKIPFWDKRSADKDIAVADQKLLAEKLNAAKAKLVQKIKNEAYTIWELQQLYNITEQYIALTKQNIKLYESYTNTDTKQHMGIMKAELSLSDLRIEKTLLASKISSAYSRLSYLSAFKVTALDISLKMGKEPHLQTLQNSLQNNPDIKIKNKELQKQNAIVKKAEINNYPDINLLAGYAYRENFDNYFNFGVGLSLPIYGTEDAKEQKERSLALSATSQIADTQNSLNAVIQTYYAQMLASYKIYHIIQDDALPQVAHMFELSSSSIATGSDLFKYIDVLFSKLDLEKKSIQAVTNYKRAEAYVSELQGELK